MSNKFTCRECGVTVMWATSKSGKRYLAQPKEWQGEQWGAKRTYLPSHYCNPTDEYRALAAAQRAEAEARNAAKQAALEAGVQAPEGRVRGVTLTVTKVAAKEFSTVWNVTATSEEGWSVWFRAPSSVTRQISYTETQCTLQVGATIALDATLTRSERDPLFAFGKRPVVNVL